MSFLLYLSFIFPSFLSKYNKTLCILAVLVPLTGTLLEDLAMAKGQDRIISSREKAALISTALRLGLPLSSQRKRHQEREHIKKSPYPICTQFGQKGNAHRLQQET